MFCEQNKYGKYWVKVMICNCWIPQNLYANLHCKFRGKKYGAHHLPSLLDHSTLFAGELLRYSGAVFHGVQNSAVLCVRQIRINQKC